MTAQTTPANVLREFGASCSTIIEDIEAVDISADDYLPLLTDSEGKALKPFGIRVGVAGNIKFDMLGGGGVGITLAFPVGDHPWAMSKVYQTSTTATGLYFLYGVRKSAPGAIR